MLRPGVEVLPGRLELLDHLRRHHLALVQESPQVIPPQGLQGGQLGLAEDVGDLKSAASREELAQRLGRRHTSALMSHCFRDVRPNGSRKTPRIFSGSSAGTISGSSSSCSLESHKPGQVSAADITGKKASPRRTRGLW